MPNLIVPIKETQEGIARRAVHSVVTQLMKHTGMHQNIPIRYPGALGGNLQPGSTLDDANTDITNKQSSKITITVAEEYKDDWVINTPVREADATAVFEDKNLDIIIKPVFSYTTATISFAYRAATRQEAEMWRDDIKVRLGENRQGFMHELEYHWAVPKYCLAVLAHLHSLREAQAGYGQTLGQYFQEHFTKRATALTTQGGKSSLLVIGEHQIGIQGFFEFIEPEQAEKDENGAAWSIQFNYKFHYQKPISTNFLYPQVVHNQWIDPRFYSSASPYSLDDRPSLKGSVKASLDIMSPLARKPPDPLGGLRIPKEDEWTPVTVPNYTTSLINWMIQVVPEDPQDIFNLNELGTHTLHPAFIKFLKTEYPYVNRRGQSFVHMTLFRGEFPVTDPGITLDENLNVRSSNPMFLREQYHLRIALVTEYTLFTERAIIAMENGGRATLLLFQSLVNDLDVVYAETLLIGKQQVPRWYIEWFFRYLRDHRVGDTGGGWQGSNEEGAPGTKGPNTLPGNPGGGSSKGYHVDWPLVSILTIIAERNEEEGE